MLGRALVCTAPAAVRDNSMSLTWHVVCVCFDMLCELVQGLPHLSCHIVMSHWYVTGCVTHRMKAQFRTVCSTTVQYTHTQLPAVSIARSDDSRVIHVCWLQVTCTAGPVD